MDENLFVISALLMFLLLPQCTPNTSEVLDSAQDEFLIGRWKGPEYDSSPGGFKINRYFEFDLSGAGSTFEWARYNGNEPGQLQSMTTGVWWVSSDYSFVYIDGNSSGFSQDPANPGAVPDAIAYRYERVDANTCLYNGISYVREN